MEQKAWIAIVVAVIVLIFGSVWYSSQPIVSAEGVSNLEVIPDKVSVNLNVIGKGVNLSVANQEAQDISEKLLLNLVIAGFDRDELKFVNYYSYEEFDYTYRTPKSTGWAVSQQLVVDTNDTSKVVGIVDAAINANAQVSYINFEVSDKKQNEYKALALEQASKDAMEKAKAIAAGQGKGLGKLVSLQNLEMPSFEPYPLYAKGGMDMMAANSEARTVAMEINPNEQGINARVRASYKLSLF